MLNRDRSSEPELLNSLTSTDVLRFSRLASDLQRLWLAVAISDAKRMRPSGLVENEVGDIITRLSDDGAFVGSLLQQIGEQALQACFDRVLISDERVAIEFRELGRRQGLVSFFAQRLVRIKPDLRREATRLMGNQCLLAGDSPSNRLIDSGAPHCGLLLITAGTGLAMVAIGDFTRNLFMRDAGGVALDFGLTGLFHECL